MLKTLVIPIAGLALGWLAVEVGGTAGDARLMLAGLSLAMFTCGYGVCACQHYTPRAKRKAVPFAEPVE